MFDSAAKWSRIAPRKARLVTDLIRGKDIDAALTALRFSKKRAAVMVRQALDAAIASAEDNDADVTRLVVTESRIDEGPTMKRWQAKDRGRAHPILKRTSHIRVAVEEV
ncbi:MAG: 50S ribosomal protein L22 [Phycisphaerales bacterium]